MKAQRDVSPEALIFVDFGVTMALQSLDNGGMSVFGKALSMYSTDVHIVISSVNLQIKNKTVLTLKKDKKYFNLLLLKNFCLPVLPCL